VVGDFGPASISPRYPARRAATCNCSRTRKGVDSALSDSHPGLREQHWLSVMPESVKLGRRGNGGIQFSSAATARPQAVIAEPPAPTPWTAPRGRISASVHSPAPRRIQRATASCCR